MMDNKPINHMQKRTTKIFVAQANYSSNFISSSEFMAQRKEIVKLLSCSQDDTCHILMEENQLSKVPQCPWSPPQGGGGERGGG